MEMVTGITIRLLSPGAVTDSVTLCHLQSGDLFVLLVIVLHTTVNTCTLSALRLSR